MGINGNAAAVDLEQIDKALPEYAVDMMHFHGAFATELKSIIDSLPLTPEMHVIDVGCGDGFYMELFASHLDERGAVTGLDMSRPYLEVANRRLAAHRWLCEMCFVNGALQSAQLPDRLGDLVWCAQSLFSLPDPSRALRQMADAVHPGGFVAVLENDTLHQLLLPWPPELELALRTAEYAYLSESTPAPEKYYVARRLPEIFTAAGIEPLHSKINCSTRRPPFGEHLLKFLDSYLTRLDSRVAGRLDPSQARQFARMTDRGSDQYLLRQPGMMIGWVNTIAWGRRAFTE
jgi:ubiquinone/menaquinone biosynthesis C-methylase UbiE